MSKRILKRENLLSFSLVMLVVALMFTLTFAGIQTLLDFWKAVPEEQWFLPFFVIPLVAGTCAVVCYFFCTLFGETDSDQHWLG
jgi:hypothetical protein